jgi:hypothetical protein
VVRRQAGASVLLDAGGENWEAEVSLRVDLERTTLVGRGQVNGEVGHTQNGPVGHTCECNNVRIFPSGQEHSVYAGTPTSLW